MPPPPTQFIGNPQRFAFEIGQHQDPEHTLRHVDIWIGGTRLCIEDNIVYLCQFINDYEKEIQRDYHISTFGKHLSHLTPPQMSAFVCSTRDQNSPNFDIENDTIYPYYRFLDLGPTTDHLVSHLFRHSDKAHFVYSFWREAWRNGTPETYHTVELDFEEITTVSRAALNLLLDT